MKKYLCGLFVFSFIFIFTQCSIYDNDFKSYSSDVDETLIQWENSLSIGDVNALSGFYSDDYMQNKIDKDSLLSIFQEIFDEHSDYSVHFQLDSKDFNLPKCGITYNLTIKDDTDTLYVENGLNVLKLNNTMEWKFIGNRIGAEGFDPPAKFERISVIETLVFYGCPNCHYTEAAVKELKEDYFPYRLVPLEYHINDMFSTQAANEFSNEHDFSSSPSIAVNGEDKFVGGNNENFNDFYNSLMKYMFADTDFNIDSIDIALDNNVCNVNITVSSKVSKVMIGKVVLCENDLSFGSSDFENVVRYAEENENLNLSQGENIVQFSFDYSDNIILENSYIVFYLKDSDTGFIIQAGEKYIEN